MAISNLITSTQKFDRPSVSSFFGANGSAANDNLQKTSSMFNDPLANKIMGTMGSLNSELFKMQEMSKKLILTFKKIIKDIQSTRKDIISKFTRLNSEINATKFEFAKSAFITPTPETPSIGDIGGAPTLVTKNDKPVSTDGSSDIMGMVKGALIGILGGPAALATLGLLTGPAGAALLAFAGGGLVLYKSLEALTNAVLNSAETKEAIARDAGKTNPQLMQENVDRVAEKNNPVARAQTYKNQEEFFANNTLGDDGKAIKKGDIARRRKDENGNEILTLSKKLKDGTAYINITTGEKYLSAEFKEVAGKGEMITVPTPPPPSVTESERQSANQNVRGNVDAASSADVGAGEGGAGLNVVPSGEPVGSSMPAPTAPAAPAASAPAPAPAPAAAPAAPVASAPAAPAASAAPVASAPAAPAAPHADNRSFLQKTFGMPARGRNTPTGAPAADVPNNTGAQAPQGDGAFADQSQARDRAQLQEGMSRNPITGEKLKGTGTPALRQRARGQVMANAAQENKAGFERIQFGASGEDYGARNQTTYGEKIIGDMKMSVPIYYNPITDKSFSPEAVIKSSERTRPEMLRGRMEQFDRQQATAAMQSGEDARVRSSVKPLQPVVMNNSSSTNIGSSGGGETNNVSGQNFPMEASNPALLPFIARQNVHYQ